MQKVLYLFDGETEFAARLLNECGIEEVDVYDDRVEYKVSEPEQDALALYLLGE